MSRRLAPGFPQTLLWLFTISQLSFISFALPICIRNADCGDGTPDTYGFCTSFSCAIISKSANGTSPFIPTTIDDIVNEVNATPLSLKEKQLIVSSAAILIEEVNPNRFLQLNLLNVDIVKELKNFSASLESSARQNQSNFEFHESMKRIFKTMNDYHTTYVAPIKSFATLGFRVVEFYKKGEVDGLGNPRVRYVVADVADGLAPSNSNFGVGAEILTWDGEDIRAVVKKLGENDYGSNEASQMSTGVKVLTYRSHNLHQVPTAKEVKIKYRASDGSTSTAQATWFFAKRNAPKAVTTVRTNMPQSMDTWALAHFGTMNYLRRAVSRQDNKNFSTTTSARCGNKKVTSVSVNPDFRRLFRVEILETDSAGPVGRIILPSFESEPTPQLFSELTRILGLLPKNGLILDARNNDGGFSTYAKTLSTLVSGIAFDRDARSIRANNFTLHAMRNAKDSPTELFKEAAARVLPALETAVRAGEQFTGPIFGYYGFPEDMLSKQPRAYFGPVVSLVNGRTYSAGDTFAAVQVDKNMSTLVGTSDNVGAGGASVVKYENFVDLSLGLEKLPGGVRFTTSFARFYRSGPNSGAIIENFGVTPHIRYYPTLKDATDGDCDLFEFLGKVLRSKSPT